MILCNIDDKDVRVDIYNKDRSHKDNKDQGPTKDPNLANPILHTDHQILVHQILDHQILDHQILDHQILDRHLLYMVLNHFKT